MKDNKTIILNRLKDGPFIELFKLEDLGNTIFSNYQRYDFFQVIWFTKVKGNKTYFLDFNEYILQDNQIVFVFPGQIDMMDPKGKEGYLFAIHPDVFFNINLHVNSAYLNGYFSNVFFSPNAEITNTLERIMDLMLQEYNADNRLVLIESYMQAFLFHVASLFDDSEEFKSKGDLVVAHIMRLIDHNFITHRETDFYANEMGVSNKKVNEIVIKGTGKTIKQHLQERLILEIKKEIRLNEKSLKEIAFSLGFNEPAYFTRFFKQHTSQTPTGFRDS